jgi:hypothetical protein
VQDRIWRRQAIAPLEPCQCSRLDQLPIVVRSCESRNARPEKRHLADDLAHSSLQRELGCTDRRLRRGAVRCVSVACLICSAAGSGDSSPLAPTVVHLLGTPAHDP